MSECHEILNKLDVLIHKNKKDTAPELQKADPRKPNDSSASCSIKPPRPEPIKFSGHTRDFATFKRNFEAIIIPAVKDASTIGLYLIQAVPEKSQHLINNIDINDHNKMMTVLEEEFATSRQVVDCIVAEIKKMKAATTDKMFVDLVEKLERSERDLNTLKLLNFAQILSLFTSCEGSLPPEKVNV